MQFKSGCEVFFKIGSWTGTFSGLASNATLEDGLSGAGNDCVICCFSLFAGSVSERPRGSGCGANWRFGCRTRGGLRLSDFFDGNFFDFAFFLEAFASSNFGVGGQASSASSPILGEAGLGPRGATGTRGDSIPVGMGSGVLKEGLLFPVTTSLESVSALINTGLGVRDNFRLITRGEMSGGGDGVAWDGSDTSGGGDVLEVSSGFATALSGEVFLDLDNPRVRLLPFKADDEEEDVVPVSAVVVVEDFLELPLFEEPEDDKGEADAEDEFEEETLDGPFSVPVDVVGVRGALRI